MKKNNYFPIFAIISLMCLTNSFEGMTAPFSIAQYKEFVAEDSLSTQKGDLVTSFIVEFNDPPLVLKKHELQRGGLSSGEIVKILESYKKKMLLDHKKFKYELSLRLEKNVDKIVKREFTGVFNGMAISLIPEEIKKIADITYIKRIVEDGEVRTSLNDSVNLIQADFVWIWKGYTGKDVVVAIIDTGIDYTHPDLGGCLGSGCKVKGGYDLVNDDNDPMDDNGHGTHVAGIVASEDGNIKKLMGVAPDAALYAFKVLNESGSGWESDVIAGIDMAVEQNVDVINLSIGKDKGDPNDAASTAADNAVMAGVVVVAAAGNKGFFSVISSPGTARKAITVGATYDKDYRGIYFEDIDPRKDQITSFSLRGPVIGDNFGFVKPDVVAPGAMICSSQWNDAWHDEQCLDEDHTEIAGTSMATPHVAGLAALLLEKNHDWSPDEIKMAIRNSAKNLFKEFGYGLNTQGYGRINAFDAIELSKPPVAFIATSGKIYRNDSSVRGTAISDLFEQFVLQYTTGYIDHDDGTLAWDEICTKDQPVEDALLCQWNIRNLPLGQYTLKLKVTGNGQESLDYVYVQTMGWKTEQKKDSLE